MPSAVTTLIVPFRRLTVRDFAEVWSHRDLLIQLGWREVQVRYKQTLLGGFWAIVQPLATMVVFTFLFGQVAKLGPEGVPYAVFSYCGLLPWTLFADGVGKSSGSLVAFGPMVKKVYFPRLVLPLSTLVASLVDFLVATSVLFALLLYYDIALTPRLLALPAIAVSAAISALAIGLWLAPLNALYRDIRHVLPFVLQLGMFVTPVIYSSQRLGQQLEKASIPPWILGLNPMTGVVEAFRWAVLPGAPSPVIPLVIGALAVIGLGTSGLVFFVRMEHSFADRI